MFGKIKSSRMYAEIMEVAHKLDLDDWQKDFLESPRLEKRALADDLSGPMRDKLEEIYAIACDSPY